METDGLTFKDLAKRELLDVLPSEDCCVRAFLSAVSRLAGSIEISARRINLCLRLDSYEVVRFARAHGLCKAGAERL